MAFSVSYVYDLVDRYSAKLKKITAVTKRFQKRIKSTSVSIKKFGTGMRKVGRNMSSFIGTAAGIAAIVFPIKAAMDFNKQMANIATLIPGNIKRVKSLKKSIRGLSKELGTSAGIIAGGMYQVISAFGDTADTVKILEINAKAAKAGLSTVTEAVTLTSGVMKAYGLKSKEAAQNVADLAFQTVKLGVTDFPQLAASIGNVTTVSALLGISQEEVFASFAALTGVTGTASKVSTQMAGSLMALLKVTPPMQKALKALGYESGKAMLKSKGLVGTFEALYKHTGYNETKMTELFGRAEALQAVFALVGEQAGNYTIKLKAMKNAAGAMNAAFKEQTDGINKVGHAWDQMKQTLADLSRVIGDILLPIFEKVINVLKPIIEKITKWIKANKNLTRGIIIITVAGLLLGSALMIIGSAIIFVGMAIGALFVIIRSNILLWFKSQIILIIIKLQILHIKLMFVKLALIKFAIAAWAAALPFIILAAKILLIIAVVAAIILIFKNWGKITDWVNAKVVKLVSWINSLADTKIGRWLSGLGGATNITMSDEVYSKKDINHSVNHNPQSVNLNGQINVGVDGGKVKSSSLETSTGGNLGFNNPAYSH